MTLNYRANRDGFSAPFVLYPMWALIAAEVGGVSILLVGFLMAVV